MGKENGDREALVLKIKGWARRVRALAGMSPMQRAMREVAGWGFDLRTLSALECFAFTGQMHTVDYGHNVRALTLWDIGAMREASLRKTFPGATVQIVDSFEQVHREENKFDLIVIDNSPTSHGRYESFDLFPSIFNLAEDRCVLFLNVIPEINATVRKRYPRTATEGSLDARRRFYAAADPERIPVGHMVNVYTHIARGAGFEVKGWFSRRRNKMIWYLVLYVSRVIIIVVNIVHMPTAAVFSGA